MKALLLAAGFGSRLGDITKIMPKPLIKVGDKTILGFCLEQLVEAGVAEVIINTHYLPEQIKTFIEEYNSPLKISLSHEEKLLGTAGTLRRHIQSLSEGDFIVMHADNYFSDSLSKFVIAHESREVGNFGTLGTFESQNPESCGVLILNSDKTIREFHEKVLSPPTNLANAAIYLFTPEITEPLLNLSENENDISRHLIPKIMNGLFTNQFEGMFIDIGTPEGLKLANSYELEFKRSDIN
jgi:mannose-1-phosphate guanylyltransferase